MCEVVLRLSVCQNCSFDKHIFTTNHVSPSLSAAQGGPLRFTSGSGKGGRCRVAAQVCTLEKSLHVWCVSVCVPLLDEVCALFLIQRRWMVDSDGARPDDDEYDRLDYIQSVLATGSESAPTSGYSPVFPPQKPSYIFLLLQVCPFKCKISHDSKSVSKTKRGNKFVQPTANMNMKLGERYVANLFYRTASPF